MSIKVVHINSKQAQGSHREYCGRAGKGQEGILGNPYWMNDESKRDEVCDKFDIWFVATINHLFYYQLNVKDKKLISRINELVELAKTKDIELACFCSPKRCHAESIKEVIETLLKEQQ